MLAVAAALVVTMTAASAETSQIEISNAWARATPAGAATAAAYLTIVAAAADRLVAVSTSAAKKADLHTMTMDGGVMKMRQIAGIDLPAGQPVTLKPGGMHIMLTELAGPLKEGQSFALNLNFATAGTREVTVTVAKIGAMGPPGADHGGMPMPMPANH